jgi:lincosamide and streptogramin A transport system ATP-binding/permease protein
LDNCVSHILSINKKDIVIQRGNFSTWLHNKELQDNFELSKNERLKKEIKRLEQSAGEKASWSFAIEATKLSAVDRGFVGAKAAKMMKRSKSIEARQNKAIVEKSKLLKNIETADALKISQIEYHTNKYLSFENLSISYEDKVVCQNISFTINKGDRIALQGKNGSGKTSILKLICDEDISYSGYFSKGSHLSISYIPQDVSYLAGNLSDFIQKHNIDESLFKSILRKLDFSRNQFDKDLSEYSLGQKKKVLISKSLSENTNLLVWDEPLNYIDIISRMQIENLILDYCPTILFVEHDKTFCENVASKYLNLDNI